MNKMRLVFAAVLIVNSVQSQSAFSYVKTYPSPNSEIAIATARPEEVEGNNFFAEANRKESEGDFNNALILFGKAAFEYNSAKLKARYAGALMRMCNLQLQLKDYKSAENLVLNVILKTYTRMGSKTGEMNSYKQLGKIYLSANRLTESMWFFTQQGIIARQLANKIGYIESVLDIARVKIQKKEYYLATADVNRTEVLAKAAHTNLFKADISATRSIIAESKSGK